MSTAALEAREVASPGGRMCIDTCAHVLTAATVVAERSLVADVDGAEARAAAEDVQQVRDLVLSERLHLGALGRGRHTVADGGFDLGGRHMYQRAVAHARRDGMLHRHGSLSGLWEVRRPAPPALRDQSAVNLHTR